MNDASEDDSLELTIGSELAAYCAASLAYRKLRPRSGPNDYLPLSRYALMGEWTDQPVTFRVDLASRAGKPLATIIVALEETGRNCWVPVSIRIVATGPRTRRLPLGPVALEELG